MKQNYIVVDHQLVILSIHRFLLAALWHRFRRGGSLYWRDAMRPRWWEPMSATGCDVTYGTLFVQPGFKPEIIRQHKPDVGFTHPDDLTFS